MGKTVKWTTKDYGDEAQKAAAAVAALLNQPHQDDKDLVDQAMQLATEGITSAKPSSTLLLEQLAILIALMKNPLLKEKLAGASARKLLKTAFKILEVAGIQPKSSRMGFLYDELHLIQAEYASMTGDSTIMIWEAELGRYSRREAMYSAEREYLLGKALARQGYLANALTHYALIGEGDGVEPFYELATLQRLVGNLTDCKTTLDLLAQRTELDDQKLNWHQTLLQAAYEGSALPLVHWTRRNGESYHKLTAKLWAFADKQTGLWNELPKAESLVRKESVAVLDRRMVQAVRGLEDLYDGETPLYQRLQQAQMVFGLRREMSSFEEELLVTLGVYRFLLRHSQEVLTQTVLLDYQTKSLTATSGFSKDVLGMVGNVEALELTRNPGGKLPPVSTFQRRLQVTAVGLQAASMLTAGKIKRFFASKDQLDELRRREAEVVGGLLFHKLGALKGGLMKLGQFVQQVQLLSPEFDIPLGRLQLDPPQVPGPYAREVIQKEFGKPPEELFVEFDLQPIGTGSLAQVYRAVTHQGVEVAVKVQYPGIEDWYENDIRMLDIAIPFVKALLPRANAAGILNEFKKNLLQEKDYLSEKNFLQEFYDHYAGHPKIVVPKPHSEFCSKRVVTMDHIEGIRLDEFVASADQDQRNAAARTIFELTFGSVLKFRAFNCDPHPGNFLFMGDGRIGFIDFGAVHYFPDEIIDGWVELAAAARDGDPIRMQNLFMAMGYFPKDVKLDLGELKNITQMIMLPLVEDRVFRIDRDWVKRVSDEQLKAKVMQKQFAPPLEAVQLLRVTWGLLSALCQLEPEDNWYQLAWKNLAAMKKSS